MKKSDFDVCVRHTRRGKMIAGSVEIFIAHKELVHERGHYIFLHCSSTEIIFLALLHSPARRISFLKG
jgi:hypothetical protein